MICTVLLSFPNTEDVDLIAIIKGLSQAAGVSWGSKKASRPKLIIRAARAKVVERTRIDPKRIGSSGRGNSLLVVRSLTG